MKSNPTSQSDRTILSRDRVRRPSRSAVIGGGPEVLEGRQLLSTDVWNGGTTNWNDATNWSGSVVPTSGDNLVFGDAGTFHSTTMPSDFTPGSITVQSNFTLNGTLNVPDSLPVTVGQGATLTLGATALKGAGSLSKLGDGTLAINTSNAQGATGPTVIGAKGTISIGSSGSLPIAIKVSSNSKLMVGPGDGGGAVTVTGATVTGADNALAGPIEVAPGSTFSPSVINNGFFHLDPGATLAPGRINGGYYDLSAGDSISTAQTLNGTFTLRPGATVNVKSADYANAFADGLPVSQSTPNDYTLNVGPDAGTTGTFGSTVSGGGKFVTSGAGTVNLVHEVTTPAGALKSATLNQSGDTVFSAATTHLATPIDIPNSPSLTIPAGSELALGASSLTVDRGSVTLNQGSKLSQHLDGTAPGTQYGQLVAGAAINLNNASLGVTPSIVPPAGTAFTIVKTTGTAQIVGQFAGLGQGATLNLAGALFRINYSAQAVTLTSLTVATTTTITPPTSTIKPGDPLPLTATVAAAAGTPTGSVTFLDGTTALGSAPLSGGVATLASASLTGGNHTITASYAGDRSFAASASAPLSEAVRPVATSLALTDTPTAISIGDSVNLVATASTVLGNPTGQVTFLDGTTPLGTSTLDANGRAQLTLSNLVAGSHAIAASFGGDSLSNPATSPTLQLTVAAVPTTVALVSPTNPSSYQQSINLTASVASGHETGFGRPTGSVSFGSGSTVLGTVPLDATGHATLPIAGLPVGNDPIVANYLGDSLHAGSSVTTATLQTVVQAATSTALAVSPDPRVVGKPVLLTATVGSAVGSPTGIVEFKDGARILGKVSLVGGQAFLITTLSSAPNHTLTALYSGNANLAGSSSQPLALATSTAPATPATSLPTPPAPVAPAPTTTVINVSVSASSVATQTAQPTPPPTPAPAPAATPISVSPATSQPQQAASTPLPSLAAVTIAPSHPLFAYRPVKHGHPLRLVIHPARHAVHPPKPRHHR